FTDIAPPKAAPASTCSTPFGITASFTPAGQRGQCPFQRVLNAFRHHCFVHDDGLLQLASDLRSTAVCSSASLRPSAGDVPRDCISAQRLSASLLRSPDRPGHPLPGPEVLNAFRHHCFVHSSA